MFELTNQTVKLESINARAEIHGEKRVPAFDLKIEAACSADVLIHFHPELRQMLYKKADAPDLVEQADPEALTALRFPKLGALKYDWEGSGYSLTVAYGLGGKSDIKVGDVKVDGLRFEPQNGGTVLTSFRLICHLESVDVGRLCEMIQQNIDISLAPPEATTVKELFGDDKEKQSQKPSRKEKQAANLAEAQKLFVAGDGKTPAGEGAADSKPLNPAKEWPFPKDSKSAA